MTIGGDLVFRIMADKAQFDRTAQKTRGSIGKLAGFARRAFAGIATAYAGAFSVDKADQQAQAEKKLSAVLKATGNAAGFTAKEIKDLASARQDLTNFGDEETINLAGLLATFKKIQGPVFKETITLAQDMSAVIGQDLKSSAIQLGKALNDPIKGLTALQRVGVSFTQKQKDQIKALQESGDIMGAQKVILAELRSEFGGSSEAMASDLQQLKNELGDTAEFFGAVLMPAVKLLNTTLGGLNKVLGPTLNLAGDVLPVFVLLKAATEGWDKAIRDFYGAFGFTFGGVREEVQKTKAEFRDLREEYKQQEDSLANISELTRLIGRNAALQREGQFLKGSGARGEGEFERLMDILHSDLGKDRLKLISELRNELDSLANPTSRFGDEIDALYQTIRQLQRADGLPGVKKAIEDAKKLINNKTGITAAIKEAREEFRKLTSNRQGDEIHETVRAFGKAGASVDSTTELADLLTKNRDLRQNQERIADLKRGSEDLKESLDPLISFNKRTGRIEDMFKEKLLDKEEFSQALSQARQDFNESVKVDPIFSSPEQRGAGPSSAIAAGTQEFNQLIATALTGRDSELKRQTKNLKQLNESAERMVAAEERVEQILRKNQVVTKPDGV